MITLTGIVSRNLSLPMNRKFSGRGLIGLPAVIMFASPLNKLMKARVTMNGGISRKAMSEPMVIPVSSPTAIPRI